MYSSYSSLDICLWQLGEELRFWFFLLSLDVGNREIGLPLLSSVACEVVEEKWDN